MGIMLLNSLVSPKICTRKMIREIAWDICTLLYCHFELMDKNVIQYFRDEVCQHQ